MPPVGWILYLLTAWMLGHSVYTRLAGAGLRWLPFSAQGTITSAMLSTEGLRFLLRQIAAFWIGVMLLTTAHYWLTTAMIALFGYRALGMTSSEAASFFLIPAALLLAAYLRRSRRLTAEDDYRPVRHPYALFKRKVITWPFAVFILLILAYATWLMYASFNDFSGLIKVGATVESELAPATALMASFSKGQNIPTVFPYFASDGIRFHFFFYYFAAILNQLGLGFVHALNIPSILALSSMLLLIGMLAYRITGRAGAFMLAPLFTIFRSSAAIFTDFFQKGKTLGWFNRAFWQGVFDQQAFIGNTPGDEVGLWTTNLFVSQRHFALGVVLLLIVVFLALPDFERGVAALPLERGKKFPTWWELTRQKNIWLTSGRQDRKRLCLIGLLLILSPFWHGSATLSTLLILAPFALFAASRLAYFFIACAALGAMWFSRWYFGADATLFSSVRLRFGFVVDPPTVPRALLYLLEMMGPLLPLMLIIFIVARWRTKLYLLSVSIPFIFAFFFQVTPDIRANHKFILISIILWNVAVAETVIRIFNKAKHKNLMRSLAVLLSLLLLSSGLYEHLILHNINTHEYSEIDPKREINVWIETHTELRAIFLTAPYAYDAFLFTGRTLWLGDPDYAERASHQTRRRQAEVRAIFSERDSERLSRYMTVNKIDYALFDDALAMAYKDTNKALFADTFEEVARFAEKNSVIYALKQDNVS